MRLAQVATLLLAVFAAFAILPIAALLVFPSLFDDEFHGKSSAPELHSWAASPSPKIVVRASDGAITVKPSTDGRITASVIRNTLCKNLSQAVAEDSLRFVRVEMVREGDTIRVVTGPTEDKPKNDYAKTGHYIEVSTSIEITVPDGARLDLRTGSGSIWVVGKPDEIRAKNACGVVSFDLDSNRIPIEEGGQPSLLKLEGYHGESATDFDGTRYQFRGIVKPTS